MFNLFNSRKAFGTVEIIFVITIILMVMLSFGGYIKNALVGRWKSAGDTFGQGKQYDPRGFGVNGEYGGTLDCFFDQSTNKWVDEDCYEERHCDCTLISGTGAPLADYESMCVECKKACWNDARCS